MSRSIIILLDVAPHRGQGTLSANLFLLETPERQQQHQDDEIQGVNRQKKNIAPFHDAALKYLYKNVERRVAGQKVVEGIGRRTQAVAGKECQHGADGRVNKE